MIGGAVRRRGEGHEWPEHLRPPELLRVPSDVLPCFCGRLLVVEHLLDGLLECVHVLRWYPAADPLLVEDVAERVTHRADNRQTGPQAVKASRAERALGLDPLH